MAEQGAPAKVSLWGRCKAWARSLTLAAIAAWMIFALLVLAVAAIWTIYFTDDGNLPYRDWLSWPRMLTTLALVVVIPLVAYYALRLWLQGDATRFPDIDYAWNAGLEALQRAGLSIDSAPLFLVIGSTSVQEARQLMAASGMSFRVSAVPEGRSPLCWYANPDGIWLFCTEVGWLSALAKLAERKLIGGGTIEDWPVEPPSGVIPPERQAPEATLTPAAPPAPQAAPRPQG